MKEGRHDDGLPEHTGKSRSRVSTRGCGSKRRVSDKGRQSLEPIIPRKPREEPEVKSVEYVLRREYDVVAARAQSKLE